MKFPRNGHWLAIVTLAMLTILAVCLPAEAYLIIFKDGFVIRGSIRQEREIIVDNVSGRSFSVPVAGTPYSIETGTNIIMFSPGQIHDIINEEGQSTPSWMYMSKYGRQGGTSMPSEWWIDEVGKWNERWERNIRVGTPQQQFVMTLRITHLTPEYVRARSLTHLWSPFYKIKEFTPQEIRDLVIANFKKDEKVSETTGRIKAAQFLAHVGWISEAEQELKTLVAQNPEEKKEIDAEMSVLDRTKAYQFVADLKTADEVGRHNEVNQKVEQFFNSNMDRKVVEKQALDVFEIKTRYEKNAKKMEAAKQYLSAIPGHVPEKDRPFYQEVSNTILNELNYDTLPRLQTFLDLTRVHLLAKSQGNPTSESPEELLAFAISGWAIGNLSSESDANVAKELWEARKFILEYQNTPAPGTRREMRKEFEANNKLSLDLMARIVSLLPPPRPHAVLDTKIQQLTVNLPGNANNDASYLLQLPPEYNHTHKYPVLIVLHQGKEGEAAMLKRWSDLAAQHGYILVAPSWTSGFQPYYMYSDREQTLILDIIKDLRGRFQVDSDRVFLFGAGEGGKMAFDVGLAHPDQFAGVLPMGCHPMYTTTRYWPNAMYLPLYIVEGNYNVESTKAIKKMMDDWIRFRYPALYFEYKGRSSEFFPGEMADMIEWMNHKTRQFPARQLGELNSGARPNEVFSTMRATDNSFYWLSTAKISPGFLNPVGRFWKARQFPATVQAKIFSQNEIHLNVKGLSQLTIWLAPGMIDFSNKVKVVLNSNKQSMVAVQPNLETLLERFWHDGDRQRVFIARIDLGGSPW